MRTLLATIVVLCACHHQANAPAPVAARVHHAPRAMAMRMPQPTDNDADRLAADLRSSDRDPRSPANLARWVRGPLVILDGDQGKVRTACGKDATGAAATWGVALVDPTKPAPRCQVQGNRLFCEQRGVAAGERNIGLYFDRAGGWVLSGILLSRVDQDPKRSEVDHFAIRLENAKCPAP
jgi:hypothetical protein